MTDGEDRGNPRYDAISGDAGGTTENAEGRDGASDCTKCTKPLPESAATHGEALLPNAISSELLLSIVRRALASLDASDSAGAREVLAAALQSREPGADGAG